MLPLCLNSELDLRDKVEKSSNITCQAKGPWWAHVFKTVCPDLEWVVRNSLTLDGVVSTEDCMLCPLTSDDVLPDYPLQHVTYFDMKE